MKADFNKVLEAYIVLQDLFGIEDLPQDEPVTSESEKKFISLFNLLLVCTGWTEDEFFNKVDHMGEKSDEPESVDDLMEVSPANKPN